MWPRFHRLLFVLFGLLALPAGVASAGGLPRAVDLAADARAAATGAMPVLVFFMSPSCPYCREVERLYLEPMHARGVYRGRLLIRRVDVDSGATLTDFSGRQVSHREFARQARATFTPTIRLYGGAGRELVPPLRGYTTPDFYGGYLENAIAQAMAQAVAQKKKAS
jgi:thioredoxin-related protein